MINKTNSASLDNEKTKKEPFRKKRLLQKSFQESDPNFEKMTLLSRVEAQSSEISELKRQFSDLQKTLNLNQENKKAKIN